jgi:hypothetical protein
VDEVDVHAVDLRGELWERVELRFRLAPVVVRDPVARELFHRRELDALRPVVDELLGGPARGLDAAAKIAQLIFGTSTWNSRMSVAVWTVLLIATSRVARLEPPPARSGGSSVVCRY